MGKGWPEMATNRGCKDVNLRKGKPFVRYARHQNQCTELHGSIRGDIERGRRAETDRNEGRWLIMNDNQRLMVSHSCRNLLVNGHRFKVDILTHSAGPDDCRP